VDLRVAEHRAGDHVEQPVAVPVQDAVVEEDEGLREADRDEARIVRRRFRQRLRHASLKVLPRIARPYLLRSSRERLKTSGGSATSKRASR